MGDTEGGNVDVNGEKDGNEEVGGYDLSEVGVNIGPEWKLGGPVEEGSDT
jgi:hypothetical protein